MGLGDLNDIFNDDPFTSGAGGSPEGEGTDEGTTTTGNTGNNILPGQDPAFR